MEHKDGQYMQSTENFVNSSIENIQQQHLNVAGCDVVGGMMGVGVGAGDVGNKYDEHQHEEHDVGDNNEWKYVKEVQQSEKQQTLKMFDDNEFEVKEEALICGSQLLGNGDGRTDGMDDRVDSASLLGFASDSNRNTYSINAEYEIMQAKQDDEKIFNNGLSNYENITDSAKHYNMRDTDDDTYLSAAKTVGDFTMLSASESIDTNNVPQVDVKIETTLSQNYVTEHDMADEEEPSSLADNTTNGTSSLSENAPHPIIEEELTNCPVGTHILSVSIEDKENFHPSQLNPDAKEFIPSYGSNPNSPTSPMPISTELIHADKTEGPLGDAYFGQFDAYANITNRNLLSDDDELVAESPRKGQIEDMDSISLPSELTEFAKEADQRPHDFQQEENKETSKQGETILNNVNVNVNVNGGNDNEMTIIQNHQYNQSLSEDFNERMASLILHDNSKSTLYNEYSTGIEVPQINDETNQYPHYSSANEEDGDVMHRSVYLPTEQPIEDVLNTVQLLPSDIGSENTSFNEGDIDGNQNMSNNDNLDINITMNIPNKESLQIEEKEHVSHSPSTEEMNINLNVINSEFNTEQYDNDEEQLFYKQQEQQQQQQEEHSDIDDIETKEKTNEIESNDHYNNQSDDIIIVDDDDDDEVACVPTARDSSGMMFDSNDHDDHFSQEKQIESCTTMVIGLETEQDNQEQFESNLKNYINEPLTDNGHGISDDVEVAPTTMINMEIELDKEILKEKAYDEAADTTYTCDTIPKNNQISIADDNILEMKSSEKSFIQEAVPVTESLKVDFALEATNDMNDEKILNIDFGKSKTLPSTEYNNDETEKGIIEAETVTEVVECIQLDDRIDSVEAITNNETENEQKPEELITEKSSEAKNEGVLTQEVQLRADGTTELLTIEKELPCEVEPVVVPIVAATVAAATVVAGATGAIVASAAARKVKEEKTSKKSTMAPNKPSSGIANKTVKSSTSVSSTKVTGAAVKKTSSTNNSKSTSATTKLAAKPKVPTTEKDISEKKPLKVIKKTTSAVKTTTTSSARSASARSVPSSVSSKTQTATGTKSGFGTTGQRTGATATAAIVSAKTRPVTAPLSTLAAPTKPTTLGVSDATKPKARPPRSTLTTQARKAAVTTAKSPIKLPSLGINGSAATKSTGTKTTSRTVTTSSTANKVFTARPAPKFTNPTVTTTTTMTKRTITTTTATAKSSLSVGNKVSGISLSKTPPAKLTATAHKTPSRTSTVGTTKVKSTSAPSSASSVGKIPSSKNTTPRPIKKPQQQQQQQQEEEEEKHQQLQIDKAVVSPTIQLFNGGSDHSEAEFKVISNMTNGDPQAFLDDIVRDHKTSGIRLTDV